MFFVAPFICNTTLILHGNKAWMGMIVIGKFLNQFGKRQYKSSFKATLHPSMMHM